jgi:uncharacterized protein (DUF1800 family)
VLVRETFTSDWFYTKENMGSLIKSPIELLVGVYRQIPHERKSLIPIVAFSRSLEQILFELPNVGGWPHHKSWIDSSSLLKRMQLPVALISDEDVDTSERTNDDVTGALMPNTKIENEQIKNQVKKAIRKNRINPDIDILIKSVGDSIIDVQDYMLATKLKTETMNAIPEDNKLEMIKKIMATPEYQLC